MQIYPDIATFKTHFDTGKTQLVWARIPSDLETPLSAYYKLAENTPYSILLESVEGGENLSRYSLIAYDPDQIWLYNPDSPILKTKKRDSDQWDETSLPSDCITSLREQINNCRIDVIDPSLPQTGTSGIFGYMSYDIIRYFEEIPNSNPNPLAIPESIFMRPQIIVLFDNVKQECWFITPVRECKQEAISYSDKAPNTSNNAQSYKQCYTQACERIENALRKFAGPLPDKALTPKPSALNQNISVQSNVTKNQYEDMVRKAIEYIYAGDIFQVLPSQRFETPFDLDSLSLYRSLRRLNPSPFLFHLKMDDFSIVGSSPEILVRVKNDKVTIRPLAGTRPRGKTKEEDAALTKDLLNDPKERAEHLMLIDLGRNDVGRVSKPGSVNVTEQYVVEYYSHVMHIVSNVEGTLNRDKFDALDAVMSGFPAGTVSGAPKIRAMEIIDELETVQRSFYGGCIGYFDSNGQANTCIALRTGLIKNGTLYVQAGGGVVADSEPEKEYEESCNKAKALLTAATDAITKSQV